MKRLDLSHMALLPNVWCVTHVYYAGREKKTNPDTGYSTSTPKFVAVMYNMKNGTEARCHTHTMLLTRKPDSEGRVFLTTIGMDLPPLVSDVQSTFEQIDVHCTKERPHLTFNYRKPPKGSKSKRYMMIDMMPYEGHQTVPAIYHAAPEDLLARLKEKGLYHEKATGEGETQECGERGIDGSGVREPEENRSAGWQPVEDAEDDVEGEDD